MMKKCYFIVPIILFLLFSVMYCIAEEIQDVGQSSKKIYTIDDIKRIDEDTKKCTEDHSDTNAGMLQCTIDGKYKYISAINDLIERLKDILTDSQYSELLLTQKKWEEYVKEYDKFLDDYAATPFAPTIVPLLVQNEKYEISKFRAERLNGLYYSINSIVE